MQLFPDSSAFSSAHLYLTAGAALWSCRLVVADVTRAETIVSLHLRSMANCLHEESWQFQSCSSPHLAQCTPKVPLIPVSSSPSRFCQGVRTTVPQEQTLFLCDFMLVGADSKNAGRENPVFPGWAKIKMMQRFSCHSCHPINPARRCDIRTAVSRVDQLGSFILLPWPNYY